MEKLYMTNFCTSKNNIYYMIDIYINILYPNSNIFI